LVPRAEWIEPDTSDNGKAMYAAHLIALVAWDRRGFAPNADDKGVVSFFEGGTPTPFVPGDSCPGGANGTGGTSGTVGTGGTVATGGAIAVGGATSAGGTTATGGVRTTGGVSASGGRSSGGSVAAGGASFTGGRTSSQGGMPVVAGGMTTPLTGGGLTGGTVNPIAGTNEHDPIRSGGSATSTNGASGCSLLSHSNTQGVGLLLLTSFLVLALCMVRRCKR
jgi:hypothetical protein